MISRAESDSDVDMSWVDLAAGEGEADNQERKSIVFLPYRFKGEVGGLSFDIHVTAAEAKQTLQVDVGGEAKPAGLRHETCSLLRDVEGVAERMKRAAESLSDLGGREVVRRSGQRAEGFRHNTYDTRWLTVRLDYPESRSTVLETGRWKAACRTARLQLQAIRKGVHTIRQEDHGDVSEQ